MIVKNITRDSVSMLAPAKINLFLEVLDKRPDGFHNINSLFQAVSLYDELEFHRTDQPGVRINLLDDKELPLDGNNLITKAYSQIKMNYPDIGGIKVELKKNIPIAAGLGGGSSDAAATLKAVNLLYKLGIDNNTLSDIGLEIGSDIPFFFSTGQVMVFGKGEILVPTDYPTDYHLVLVNPGLPISTAESYAALKRGLTKPKIPYSLGECRTVDEFISSLIGTGNDFEEVHLKSFTKLVKIKEGLQQTGAELVRMSGSGPTMFGLYKEMPVIKENEFLDPGDWHISAVQPIALNGLAE